MLKQNRILIPAPTIVTNLEIKLQRLGELGIQVCKNKTDESYFTRIFSQTTNDAQKIQNQRLINNNIPTLLNVGQSKNIRRKRELRLQHKIKKNKKKNPVDYKKNICGYITKKIIREFTSTDFEYKVLQLCKKYNCNFNQAKIYYSNKIQHVTGPSHIPSLLIPQTSSQQKFKLAFRQFFEWFLRQHYLRYLLNQGKMSDKKAYIDYKNKQLLYLINCNQFKRLTKVKKQSLEQKCKQEFLEQPIKHKIIHIPIITKQSMIKQQKV